MGWDETYTDIGSWRFRTRFRDRKGRAVILHAGLMAPVEASDPVVKSAGGPEAAGRPWTYTGFVTDAWEDTGGANDQNERRLRQCQATVETARDGAGHEVPVHKINRDSLFPYSRAGLLSYVNKQFGTGFTAVRLLPLGR
ncbi:hypothetical protein CRD59_06955 [Bifidobacterium xylocopae]|uniref:Uncharacterized protein n=2 Tax=Bifidobacterium xylocopae TaxID=2493119 RepID=A0A366KCH9_9BIFI|nr:hypothetical protein CRD59_06955 [Bifidobacterium xylocopae]